MSKDEFSRLFSYMSDRFDAVDKALETKANTKDVDKILTVLDGVVKRQEIEHDKRLAIVHQLDWHNNWIHKLADKTGYKLSS